MAGTKRPARPYAHKLEARIITLEARMVGVMDGVEKLAVMVQNLSIAYGRILAAAQAASESRGGETVSEGGIVLPNSSPTLEVPK